MSIETHYLPFEDRFILAFSDLIERLTDVKPSRDAVFPVATVVSGDWTVAGEESDEMAVAMTTFFFQMLEEMARRERDL